MTKHNNSKPMGFSKSSSKREVYSNTTLPQETRKTSNRQPNFTPKTTGKRRTTRKNTHPNQQKEEIIKIQAEVNQKEMKEKIVKINKNKSWFFEKNKIGKPLARLIKKKREESNQQNQKCMCVDLSLGFLFCSIDLYFCLCASTILS